jgi:hypothetical protein
MEEQKNTRLAPTRPKDRSLKAYKVWMRELIRRFTTWEGDMQLTEREWRESWQEYWKEHSKDQVF